MNWLPVTMPKHDYMDAADGFAAHLRAHRLGARLSQEALGALVGCNHTHVCRIEAGNRNPSRDMAVALCDALDVHGVTRVEMLAAAGFVEYPLSAFAAATVADDHERVRAA